jgi:hypothetical protein
VSISVRESGYNLQHCLSLCHFPSMRTVQRSTTATNGITTGGTATSGSTPALSSQAEFITVDLILDGNTPAEVPQMVEAVYGSRLVDCLQSYLDCHQIPASLAEFFLDKSNTPIPENSPAQFLAGHKVFVRVKKDKDTRRRHAIPPSVFEGTVDIDSHKSASVSSMGTISRKSSFSHRKMLKPRSLSTCQNSMGYADDVMFGSNEVFAGNRKNSLNTESPFGSDDHIGFHSSGNDVLSLLMTGDEYGTRRARSNNSARSRLFFNKDKLNAVMEKIYPQVVARTNRPIDITFVHLEDHWTDLVLCHAQLSERARLEQEAIWEIVTTEQRYINVRLCYFLSFFCYFVI